MYRQKNSHVLVAHGYWYLTIHYLHPNSKNLLYHNVFSSLFQKAYGFADLFTVSKLSYFSLYFFTFRG